MVSPQPGSYGPAKKNPPHTTSLSTITASKKSFDHINPIEEMATSIIKTTSTRKTTKSSFIPKTKTIPALIYCEREEVLCREKHLTPYCNLTLVDQNGDQMRYCNNYVPVISNSTLTTTTTTTMTHMSMTMSMTTIPSTITTTSEPTTVEAATTSSEMTSTTTSTTRTRTAASRTTTSTLSESTPC